MPGMLGVRTRVWPLCALLLLSGAAERIQRTTGKGRGIFRLRGGNMELNRTIIVPSEKHPSIQEGLEDVCMIDQLKLKKGVHRLPFTYPIVSRTISVSGEDETWVIGSWKVSEDGRGRCFMAI
eukprot:765217-Hanusia_phi.AAC.4